jgi:MATE family multidrug resistance protein
MCITAHLLVAVGMFPDMWQGYVQGVVKALGIQKRIIWLNIIAYYVINLPLSIIFAFKLNWGFKGIWWAMIFAQMFMGITI